MVLSGCGVYDGSECTEAVSMMIALTKHGIKPKYFAPDINQMHVINHIKGEPMEQERNVMQEAARLCRGDISAIEELKAEDFDALCMPGGFGAAKNLSTFAT